MLLALAGHCISTAQSAEPVSLTLACQGTVTMHVYAGYPETVSMGLIVNFTTHTVKGEDCVRTPHRRALTRSWVSSCGRCVG
jgi:hypothetical protein